MKLLIIFTILIGTTDLYAAKKVGAAGCGLGNVIFDTDTQVLASTTNGSSGNQTFGITSGTSNCVESSNNARIENFIEVNKVALTNDISRGHGESIDNLAVLLKCTNSGLLGSVLKDNYRNVFTRPESTSREIHSGVKNSVEKNTELSKQCNSNV